MGVASSIQLGSLKEKVSGKSENDLVKLLLPLYYIDSPFVPNEFQHVLNSWRMIIDNSAPGYVIARNENKTAETSCSTYFHSLFYQRLFDTQPTTRDLFENVHCQGVKFVHMISSLIDTFRNWQECETILIKLAKLHNERGVKAAEYGVAGEVLFATLSKCLVGEYTPVVHKAWVKLYSSLLKVILPVAVHHELLDDSPQMKRFYIHMTKAADDTTAVSTYRIINS